MALIDRALVQRCLGLVMRPAVSFAARHSIRLQDFIECAKAVYIEVSEELLKESGEKVNTSRLAVMSGVHRRDVTRIQRHEEMPASGRDLITKIVGLWQTDRRFVTKAGGPRVLEHRAERSEFIRLVEAISQDLNPGTVLFELKRVGAVIETRSGLRLVAQSYIPKGDAEAGFRIFAREAEDLCRTVDENVLSPGEIPQFHARTEYDKVRPEALPEIRRWLIKEGHEFHARVREFVSRFDQDINPDPDHAGPAVRVTFSSFGHVNAVKETPTETEESKE
jgi:hypothetical protein